MRSKTKIGAGLFGAMVLLAVASSLHSRSNRSGRPDTITSGNVKPAASANLQLILEGPMAVCMAPENKRDSIMILIPRAKGHFQPGFDAGADETLLCQGGEYEFVLEGHEPGNATPGDEFDRLHADCPSKGDRYLSLLVHKPDQILPFTLTDAKIAGGDGSSKSGYYRYASRTVLYYAGVSTDPKNSYVVQRKPEKCEIEVSDGPFKKKKIEFPFPFKPKLVYGENRLLLSMTPTKQDDASHHHARGAYRAVAKMVGVHRSVEFPPLSKEEEAKMVIGPHNDCRAPQMFMLPPEVTRRR